MTPKHGTSHFKKVGEFWSARVGLRHRAVGRPVLDGVLWFWIGSHAEYDRTDRERVEHAVRLGIGVRERSVDYFSIVARQDTDNWQVQIKLKLIEKPVYVNIYGPDRDSPKITELVAAALAGVLP